MIKLGDRVKVDFHCSQYTLTHDACVDHIPTATGDSWAFIDWLTGQYYYVSEGCTITLLQGKGNERVSK